MCYSNDFEFGCWFCHIMKMFEDDIPCLFYLVFFYVQVHRTASLDGAALPSHLYRSCQQSLVQQNPCALYQACTHALNAALSFPERVHVSFTRPCARLRCTRSLHPHSQHCSHRRYRWAFTNDSRCSVRMPDSGKIQPWLPTAAATVANISKVFSLSNDTRKSFTISRKSSAASALSFLKLMLDFPGT